jgi:hypothetical protein
LTETWERLGRSEGDYIFERGDNVENYMKTCGYSSLIKYLDTYKIHIRKKDKTIFMRKRFGDLGTHYNRMELDVESPYYTLGCRRGNGLLSSIQLQCKLLNVIIVIVITCLM